MAMGAKRGGLEYPDGIEEVRGSNPLGSTRKAPRKGGFGLRKARVLGIVEDR
jgi:hypothetical protein